MWVTESQEQSREGTGQAGGVPGRPLSLVLCGPSRESSLISQSVQLASRGRNWPCTEFQMKPIGNVGGKGVSRWRAMVPELV